MFNLTIEDPETFSPFHGDGRKKVHPTEQIKKMRPGTAPMPLTRGVARTIIFEFWKHGRSNHSATATTMWVIEVWAHVHNIPIKIIKHPAGGWYVKRIEDESPSA